MGSNIIEKSKKFVRTFPKKHHLEYIVAILSIPVLLSVVTLNLINLRNNTEKKPEPTQIPAKPVIIQVTEPHQKETTVNPTSATCKKNVGPIDIGSPKEGERVKDNPVCVTINYDTSGDYCSVVWSYRINGGSWSEFNNTSPCLYNVPKGDVKFELRVQSTVAQDKTAGLVRNFTYEGSSSASPSATP